MVRWIFYFIILHVIHPYYYIKYKMKHVSHSTLIDDDVTLQIIFLGNNSIIYKENLFH